MSDTGKNTNSFERRCLSSGDAKSIACEYRLDRWRRPLDLRVRWTGFRVNHFLKNNATLANQGAKFTPTPLGQNISGSS